VCIGVARAGLAASLNYPVLGFAAGAACRFAVDQGKGQDLRGALLKLEEQNKASLNVDSWFSAYHHSHPHLVERLSAIDAALKKDS
jgi:Zn-dependent protease with chaperone function